MLFWVYSIQRRLKHKAIGSTFPDLFHALLIFYQIECFPELCYSGDGGEGGWGGVRKKKKTCKTELIIQPRKEDFFQIAAK